MLLMDQQIQIRSIKDHPNRHQDHPSTIISF